jgi:hypothetical protein
VQVGRQWLKFLEAYGDRYNKTRTSGPAYVPGSYKSIFVQSLALPDPVVDPADLATVAERAAVVSARSAHQFLKASAERAVDGSRVYDVARGKAAWPGAVAALPPEHLAWINQAAGAFGDWFDQLYFRPAAEPDQAWSPQALEYKFACAVSEADGSHTVLTADGYASGNLDFYAFDVDPNRTTLAGSGVSIAQRPVENRILSVIPAEARFPGMPAFRWWELEDRCVDLGSVQADTTDLAKILLLEFALMYSNDWFLVPVKVPSGSLSAIKGLVVTDVFGQRTSVGPAGELAAGDWSGWSLFGLTIKPRSGQWEGGIDPRMFLPPTVAKVQESEPVEEVKFIRDETANMVWAVETRVADLLGQSQDGNDAARQLRSLLEDSNLTGTETVVPQDQAAWIYRFANGVPESWIPFIPAHKANDVRSIQLQRGSMPRSIGGSLQPVRPRTLILRTGLNADQTQAAPYFIDEEEVTRAGAVVASAFRRARWYSGAVFTWYGERKTLGRGEGGSGLKFDYVDPAGK